MFNPEVFQWLFKPKEKTYNEAVMQAILTSSLDAYVTINDKGEVKEWNPIAEKMFGFTEDEALNKNLSELIIPARFVAAHRYGMRMYKETGENKILRRRVEVTAKNKIGYEFPVELFVVPVETSEGSVFVASIRDLTEKQKALEKDNMLKEELNHRIKNIMTVVQSLAHQTLKSDPELTSVFLARLYAMSKAHDLLFQNGWESAELATVVRSGVNIYGGSERFDISGTQFTLPANAVVSFALVINELCTNSVKYGSLSTPEGKVNITWARVKDNLIWTWEETGGPPVKQPENKGFGLKLIKSAFSAEGTTVVDFNSKGLKATLILNFDKVS